jgi:hypothetical protein
VALAEWQAEAKTVRQVVHLHEWLEQQVVGVVGQPCSTV